MFQSAGLLHPDEVPVDGLTIAELDTEYFKAFYEKQFDESFDKQNASLTVVLENMNLMKNGVFNLAGALLFSKRPQIKLPNTIIKSICFPGNEIHVSEYRDSEDISGKLEDGFKKALSFITRNISHVQDSQDVNSQGNLEITKIALEELLTNALIHRDFFVSACIKIMIFDNRIELISPGHLPNNLTLENIKSGVSNIRNPVLASHGTKILPYRGLGNGIRRALEAFPNIEFIDDRDGNQFVAIIHRREKGKG